MNPFLVSKNFIYVMMINLSTIQGSQIISAQYIYIYIYSWLFSQVAQFMIVIPF